jgi:hypothetical protein
MTFCWTGGSESWSFLFFPVPKLWVPRPCVFCKGRYQAPTVVVVSAGLNRTCFQFFQFHGNLLDDLNPEPLKGCNFLRTIREQADLPQVKI